MRERVAWQRRVWIRSRWRRGVTASVSAGTRAFLLSQRPASQNTSTTHTHVSIPFSFLVYLSLSHTFSLGHAQVSKPKGHLLLYKNVPQVRARPICKWATGQVAKRNMPNCSNHSYICIHLCLVSFESSLACHNIIYLYICVFLCIFKSFNHSVLHDAMSYSGFSYCYDSLLGFR